MDHHEASKRTWSTKSVTGATLEEINSGSLQRIADATELMALSHSQLIEHRDMYKRWWRENQESFWAEQRKTRALRGVITKLKNKAEGK